MTPKEKTLGIILDKIADEISITPAMQEKAVSSYTAVGTWLGDGIPYNVRIMPQGSMNLGTVIKPVDDSDDYDIDLVCLLENGQGLALRQIKNMVGDRLKENTTYRRMLEREGKRCWTLQYKEFHMDILPCVPRYNRYIEPDCTAIKLTHKNEEGEYESRFSDPYAYHKWFESCMLDILTEEKRKFAAENKVEIERVPTYKIRTPLQKAIQLLKRHRDVCFNDKPDNAPISIIITTLAAWSYSGEVNLYEALCNILTKMPEHIHLHNGIYWVENPVMKEENFAEKWTAEPEKRDAFYSWLKQAYTDLLTNPLECYGLDTVSEHYQKVIGEAPVKRAMRAMGNETKAARKSGDLYLSGLTGGLTTSPSCESKPVKEHTFFGQ